MTNNIELYHGSDIRFENFSLDNLGKHGTAQGYGVYLTSNTELAKMYSEQSRNNKEQEGYLYTVTVDLENELSLDSVTLTEDEISNIILELHNGYGFLDNYGDTAFEGFEKVKNEAFSTIMESNDNDVDILNDIATTLGDRKAVTEIFYKEGQYTHILAHEQTIKQDDVYIILNPEKVNIKSIDVVNNELNIGDFSNEEQNYFEACVFLLNDNESIKLISTNEILFSDKSDQKIYESISDLYQEKFNSRFENVLDVNYPEDIKNELGEDIFNFLLEKQNKELQQSVTKELDLDTDGVSDRIDYNDQANSIADVGDTDKRKNRTQRFEQDMDER